METRNRLLLSLSREELKAIKPYITSVALKNSAVVHELGAPIEHVYFMESGIVSLMNMTAGRLIETATAGRNGAAGGIVALETVNSAHHSIVLIGGRASRITTTDLLRLMADGHSIRSRLLQNAVAVLMHASQTALCATRHELTQRLSCWLATTFDALDGGAVAITHERLADILGLRRAGLTEALTKLETDGILRKSRGLLHVHAPDKLKQRACHCYRIIANAYRCEHQSRSFESASEEMRMQDHTRGTIDPHGLY
ncbi:Crp/Fnr family transcriptional regulator [Tardiphaga sp.]|uniref:Crp/Fnr family transcriptional regulator n=1 Tax=Tardiphaga sp. TaxID=1926292 RepID=UPI0025DFE266|nr:Crp/Fnr family transcriptional regulator [Tardiphaga sp.]